MHDSQKPVGAAWIAPLALASLFLLTACAHSPTLSKDSPWQQYRDVKGPACFLHWGEQTQRWADRLLPPCEELRRPKQRVYMFVMTDEQARDLVASGYFGDPPPFKTVRGFAVRYGVIRADGIAINETVLDDGMERQLIVHELCHHWHGYDHARNAECVESLESGVAVSSQALAGGSDSYAVIAGEDGRAVTVPLSHESARELLEMMGAELPAE